MMICEEGEDEGGSKLFLTVQQLADSIPEKAAVLQKMSLEFL